MAGHQKLSGWPVTGTRWRISASWAVLYPSGAYQAPHLHRDISCVLTYYARVPVRPRPEGAIGFINPHIESTFPARKNWPYDRHYFPMDGTCLVFPGWLQHFAHPHFAADEERLMFSLDVSSILPDSRVPELPASCRAFAFVSAAPPPTRPWRISARVTRPLQWCGG
jgi:hypothetical protein